MPKKDYVKRDITFVGRTQDTEDDKACEVCVEGDKFLSSATRHDNRISYSKIEVDTEQGEKIAEEEHIGGIPFIKDCKTYEDGGKPRCRKIEGFEQDDWDDLSQLIIKEATSSSSSEAEKTASEVKESEPSEPKATE